jgi:hypothetical protein
MQRLGQSLHDVARLVNLTALDRRGTAEGSADRHDGALVAPDLLLHRADIADALAKSRLPAVYPFREYAGVGGLVHGANLGVLFERAAGYVDRILKGTKPSDLPVQLATEFELIINLRTTRSSNDPPRPHRAPREHSCTDRTDYPTYPHCPPGRASCSLARAS